MMFLLPKSSFREHGFAVDTFVEMFAPMGEIVENWGLVADGWDASYVIPVEIASK